MHTIEYSVNDEPQRTGEHTLTAKRILELAGFVVAQTYLILLRGKERVSYKDNPGDEIHMHPHMKFLAISCEPTPLS
jgi:hypothetical protein